MDPWAGLTWKTLDWREKGGSNCNTEDAPKKDFGAIPYFLVIADYKKAFLYEALKYFLYDMDELAQQINFKSVLPKQNTFKSVLENQNTFKSVMPKYFLCCQNTFVFWP